MDDLQTAILAQIDALLDGQRQTGRRSPSSKGSDTEREVWSEVIMRLSSAIDRLAPPASQYRVNSLAVVQHNGPSNPYNIPILVGALKALRADYAAGYLKRVEQLVESNVFSDFLDMAEYLLDQGYKDPAAVLIGGVLEEHLRKLCARHGVDHLAGGKPKKADAMNGELATANVYNKLDQKSVTTWLDLRNKAAHGKYTEYSQDQAKLMLQSIRDFLSRNP